MREEKHDCVVSNHRKVLQVMHGEPTAEQDQTDTDLKLKFVNCAL